MKSNVWQTTNQQPWVEALAAGVITVKTRTSHPVVPIGATVLLHASKAKLWPHWKGLNNLLPKLPEQDSEKWQRGTVCAIGIVEAVGWSDKIMKPKEIELWDVNDEWNSVANYSVRFSKVKRLKHPVEVRGFQAPFARAKEETIKKVLKYNPELKEYLS